MNSPIPTTTNPRIAAAADAAGEVIAMERKGPPAAPAPDEWKNEAAQVLAQFIHLSVTPDRDAWAANASRAIRLLNTPAGMPVLHGESKPPSAAAQSTKGDE